MTDKKPNKIKELSKELKKYTVNLRKKVDSYKTYTERIAFLEGIQWGRKN